MTKKELVWRLASKPTIDDITKLIETKVITPEEARTIAFNSLDENDKIAKLEQEVEVLKTALHDANRGVIINRQWVGNLPQIQMVDPFKLLRSVVDL